MAGADEEKNKLIFGWLLDYICHMTWQEFSETLSMSTGIMSQGIYDGKNRQKMLLLLMLSRLADGSESYDTAYEEDSNITVLEDMIPLFEKLARLQTDSLVKEGLELVPLIKSQAVMVVCRHNDFETGRAVFKRQWQKKQDKITANMEILQVILDSGQDDHESLTKSCYSDFVKTIIAYLGKIHAQLALPLLIEAADRFLKFEKIGADSTQDGMPVQHSSPSNSKFSADVIRSAAADDDLDDSNNNNNTQDFNPSKQKMRRLQSQSTDELFGVPAENSPKHSSTPKSSSNTRSPARSSSEKPGRANGPVARHSLTSDSDISDLSDDNVSVDIGKTALSGVRKKWTEGEMEEFYFAAKAVGEGQWAKIRDRLGSNRTGAQLKDKWRNMLKCGDVDKLNMRAKEKKKKK